MQVVTKTFESDCRVYPHCSQLYAAYLLHIGMCQTILCSESQVLVTHYSGYDAPGIALEYLEQQLAKQNDIATGVVPVHACDISPLCRKVLLCFPEKNRHQHLFADMLDRVPADVQTLSLHLQRRSCGFWRCVETSCSC